MHSNPQNLKLSNTHEQKGKTVIFIWLKPYTSEKEWHGYHPKNFEQIIFFFFFFYIVGNAF